MSTRERHLDRVDTAPGAPAEANAGHISEPLREIGDDFLAAADEAIDRALSGDSEAFLAQNRQMGGQ